MQFNHILAVFLSVLVFSSPVHADSDSDADEAAVSEFMKSEVVKKFHNNAYGYAVFPNIGKGGFGIGGAYGKGRVYRGGKKTGDVSMAQVSIGFQAGGQAFSQIIFFENEATYLQFTSGEFEFGAQATAVAITLAVPFGLGASV